MSRMGHVNDCGCACTSCGSTCTSTADAYREGYRRGQADAEAKAACDCKAGVRLVYRTGHDGRRTQAAAFCSECKPGRKQQDEQDHDTHNRLQRRIDKLEAERDELRAKVTGASFAHWKVGN